MNVKQLKSILMEYPMSMRLIVTVKRRTFMETTVVEMVLKLMAEPPNASGAFCELNDCIIRERVDEPLLGEKSIRKEWLEIDMR